jgi:signal transduction histidine kinase
VWGESNRGGFDWPPLAAESASDGGGVGATGRPELKEQKGRLPVNASDSNRQDAMKSHVAPPGKRFSQRSLPMALQKAWSGYAHWLALGVLVGVAIFSTLSTATVIQTTRSQLTLRTLLNELQAIISTVDDAETGQRGYLLVGEESYLEPYREAVKVSDREVSQVAALIGATPDQQARFDRLRQAVALKFAELQETIRLRQTVGIDAAMQVVRSGRGKGYMDEIRVLVGQMKEAVQEQLAGYDRLIVTRATGWTVLGNLLAAVLFITVLLRERRKRSAMEDLARKLGCSVETLRQQAAAQSQREIDSLGQQAQDLGNFLQALQEQTFLETDDQIESLRKEARELVSAVETWRTQSLAQSAPAIEAIGLDAFDSAPLDRSGPGTLRRADAEFDATELPAQGLPAKGLATAAATPDVQTLARTERTTETVGHESRDLSTTLDELRKNALIQAELERRKLTTELERRVVQLEASNKELEAFSYSVSHDLRAPLRAIDGFSRIVLEDYGTALADQAKSYLQMVRDNTQQMGRLVDDLLAFSRFGRQALTKQVIDPDSVVRRCLEELMKEHQGRQIEIAIGDLPECNADPNLLKQVWMNLIANALKYTSKRELARIEVGCRVEPRLSAQGVAPTTDAAGTERVYFIRDNGAGFDMRYAHKLFGVFQRLHRAADYAGTGVGLAIVQRIVQRHGGRAWGEGSLDQGATFYFTLA